jgi:hypothetical protein
MDEINLAESRRRPAAGAIDRGGPTDESMTN